LTLPSGAEPEPVPEGPPPLAEPTPSAIEPPTPDLRRPDVEAAFYNVFSELPLRKLPVRDPGGGRRIDPIEDDLGHRFTVEPDDRDSAVSHFPAREPGRRFPDLEPWVVHLPNRRIGLPHKNFYREIDSLRVQLLEPAGADIEAHVQFTRVPTAVERSKLQEKHGITLFSYDGANTYTALIAKGTDLENVPLLRWATRVIAEDKFSPALLKRLDPDPSSHVDAVLHFRAGASDERRDDLLDLYVKAHGPFGTVGTLQIATDRAGLFALAREHEVRLIEHLPLGSAPLTLP
jgi:hypothetical protein